VHAQTCMQGSGASPVDAASWLCMLDAAAAAAVSFTCGAPLLCNAAEFTNIAADERSILSGSADDWKGAQHKGRTCAAS
jgi:hypothetical protein